MTDTLFDIVRSVYEKLGRSVIGTATGGTTTTIVDTANLVQDDDYWNRGTALILYDAGGAGAAPQGEWATVTDFAAASDTATITALTAAVAAGDRYMLCPPRWELSDVISKVNTVLNGIFIPATDTTSLDTADNQTEYTLPATIPAQDLRAVYLQTYTDDANDNQWFEMRDWTVKQIAGAADVLILPQLASGYDLRLDYVKPHAALYSASDELDAAVHLDRITHRVAEMLFATEIGWQDNWKNAANMANYFRDKADQADIKHYIKLPRRKGALLIYPHSQDAEYTGEVGKVRL